MSASGQDHESQSAAQDPAAPLLLGLIPRRLGPETTGPLPDHMHGAIKLALDWQQTGAYAEFWEVAGAEENRLYELAGCKAGIGEQVGLACTAERDHLGWQQMELQGVEAVEAEMAKRALAEIAGHYVLGAGHGLFNLAARTVALDEKLKNDLGSKLGTNFPPLSERVEDWPSASPSKAGRLKAVAHTSSIAEIRIVADPVLALVDSAEWRRLNDARGSDFHRWRVQTDGICGVAKRSPWKKGDGIRSLEGGLNQRLGKDTQARIAAETLAIAVTARDKLIEAARAFEQVFAGALTATTRLTAS